MALQFNPPDWLIQQYLQQPRPIDKLAGTVATISDQYAQRKAAQHKEALAQQQRDTQTFTAVAPYAEEAAIPGLAKQYGVNIPSAGSTPPVVSTGTAVTPNEMAAQQSLPSEHPEGVPETSPLIQAHSDATGWNPTGKIPTSKAGLAKYKKNLETQKLQKELDKPPKGPEGYYDVSGNKHFDLPPGSHLLPDSSKGGSSSTGSQHYIGNAEDGSPVNQDKQGNFFVNGQPYNGKILSKSSETATASTRSSAEFAKTVVPHIQDMRNLVKEADQKGYIGPAAGRAYNQFMAGSVGSTGNPDADKLLGRLRATDSLLKTGAMKAHFGARGGQQMYDHFSELLNSGKQSAAMLNGSLDTLESFMQGYADAGSHNKPAEEDGYLYTPGPGGKGNKANWKKK